MVEDETQIIINTWSHLAYTFYYKIGSIDFN